MEKSDECIIVYIDLDSETTSLVQEATEKFEKIETISLADFSNLNLTELNNGCLLIFPVNSIEDVGHYCYELQGHKKSTDLFRKILLVKSANVASTIKFNSQFDLLICEEWPSAKQLLSTAISEQDIRIQNQAFKAFLEHSVDGYWIWDVVRNKIEWSKRTGEIVGININKNPKNIEAFIDLIDPLDRDRVEQAINSHFKFKVPYRNVEMRLRGADSTYRHFMANGTALRNKEGTPVLFVGSLTDRTLIQRVEKRLEDTEKRFTVLFHQMNDAALLADIGTGLILEANQPAERLWGKPVSELVGLHQSELHPSVLSEEAELAFKEHIKALKQNKRATICVPILRVDGVEVPAEISSSLIELEGETRILGFFRDISDRVKLERDVRERDAQLQLSSHMASMGTLAAGVAHEINNPLTYMLGNLEILKSSVKKLGISNSEIEETISSAITGGQLVKEIVTDLKTLSQSDESIISCDPCEVIRIASRVAMSDLRHSATLIMDLPEVPKVALPSARLSQVVLNILSNSSRAFNKFDSMLNEIKINVEADGDYAKIIILDNGEGIDTDDLKRIWEPFFTKSKKSGGTGLGLSICRRILSEVNGSIEIESKLKGYTRVTILLPFAKEVPDRIEELQIIDTALETPCQNPKIMVVDDDSLVLELITKILEEDLLVCS
jgi:PAS domain S-box-containing protein